MPQEPRIGDEQIQNVGIFPRTTLRPAVDPTILEEISRTTSVAEEITAEHEKRLATDPEYQETWLEIQEKAAAYRERQKMAGWMQWRGPLAIAAGAGIAWFARGQRWI